MLAVTVSQVAIPLAEIKEAAASGDVNAARRSDQAGPEVSAAAAVTRRQVRLSADPPPLTSFSACGGTIPATTPIQRVTAIKRSIATLDRAAFA